MLNANRAEDARRDRRTTLTKDHEGGDVSLTWFVPGKKTKSRLNYTPALPYQVYTIKSAVEGSSMQVLDQFCAVMYDFCHRFPDTHHNYRFDIYQTPREDYIACVEHQRKEVAWRNQNGIWPRLATTWSTSETGGDKGFILVIDSVDIVKYGISLLYFDPDEYHDPVKRRRVWHPVGDEGNSYGTE